MSTFDQRWTPIRTSFASAVVAGAGAVGNNGLYLWNNAFQDGFPILALVGGSGDELLYHDSGQFKIDGPGGLNLYVTTNSPANPGAGVWVLGADGTPSDLPVPTVTMQGETIVGFQYTTLIHPKLTIILPFGVPQGANGCWIQSTGGAWQYKLDNDPVQTNPGFPVASGQIIVLNTREQIEQCTLGPDPIPPLAVQFFTGNVGSQL